MSRVTSMVSIRSTDIEQTPTCCYESEQDGKLAVLLKERERDLQNTMKEMQESKREQQKIIQEQQDHAEKITGLLKGKEDTTKELADTKREQHKLAQNQREHSEKLAALMKQKEDTTKELADTKREQHRLTQYQREQAAQMKEVMQELEKIRQRQKEAEEKLASATQQRPTQIITAEPENRLRIARKMFIQRISDPILKELLDELLHEKIITDGEMKTVMAERITQDKARQVVDMVCNKGNRASAFMIDVIDKLDRNLCETLQLKQPPGK